MDRDIIERKLESLRQCVQRVREKCPATPEALARDIDAQDIVSLNLTRAVQLCVDIATHLLSVENVPMPDTMGQSFDRLAELGYLEQSLADRLKRAVGFRNIVVHNYEAIDWVIVHALATRSPGDFKQFAKAISGKFLA